MSSISWIRHGLVFAPAGEYPWMQSHASNPVVHPLDGTRVRCYFSTRDARDRSHVAFVEVDLLDPTTILRISEQPALSPGPLGYFDDHGTYAMSLVEADDRLWLYYVGWNPGLPPLYYPSIGLASSDDGGETFHRVSAAPILGRSREDPWMVSSPYVLREGDLWRMWYLSGIGWRQEGDALRSYYHLKYAESADGVAWDATGRVAIDLQADERNIARMCVVRDRAGYQGWYSVAGGDHGYRIGMATSQDGLEWERLDSTVGLPPSASGWDAEELAYPFVHVHEGRRFLFYSGNGVGRGGFGVAEEISR